MAQTYDAACPHCGELQKVKLQGLFASPERGTKAVICPQCDMPFVVAWEDAIFEVRRER